MTRLFIISAILFVGPLVASYDSTPHNVPIQVDKVLNCIDQALSLCQEKVVCNHLIELKRDIQDSLQRNDFEGVKDACMCAFENSPEILAECSDCELRAKLTSYLCLMEKEIEGLNP
jgi:hypothetical protein